ncbi:AMP-binding protein [Streptomyces sp. NPDC085946]|uniref:AMP-binding protein n=1 Tax=Streptomyces sp. NPDC085946 TaxID=3365744 RepID=UPI0037D25B20
MATPQDLIERHAVPPAAGGRTVHGLLDEAVAETPHRPAVRDATGAWTYAQLADRAARLTAWLAARGVGRGDRVLLQLPTGRPLAALFYATVRRGAVFVPVHPAMKPFHLRSVVADADPALVLTDTEGVHRLRPLTGAPVHDIADVLAETAAQEPGPDAAASPDVSGDDLATLIYTSGSTAAPKAVACPHAAVVFASTALVRALDYRCDDVVFCRFPMSWDYGLYKVLMTCIARCEIVLADGDSDFTVLRRMHETGTTVVPIVPSYASMIVSLARRHPDQRPPVRMFTNTGAALPAATADALRALFPGARVVRQYGQTEAKRITVMPPEEEHERPHSVGRALPGTRVLVCGPDGETLPPGTTGEIVAVGPHVMRGYWRNPEATARSFRPDPDDPAVTRLHTGDYGHLDEDGYLYFQGRRDDMFKRKGFRMSTVEIETAALDIPGVRAAAALPPDDRHDLTLFVESDLDERTVVRELMERLETAKMPARCRVLAEFPLTLHGKNARRELAALIDGERP